jgi:hypothetical protein
MILFIMQMKVLAEKRKELSQTIALLIGSIKTEKDAGGATFSGVWRMEIASFFLKNGTPGKAFAAT